MTITFCTFNIRYGSANDGDDCWDNRRGLVCDLWRTSGWDVVGIQEGLRHQIDHIRGEVPEYAEVGVGRNDGVSAGEHCAILFRADRFDLLSTGTFWLSKTPDVVGSRHPGTRHSRICTWAHLRDIDSGRAFLIYNAHTDHESQEARQWSSDLIIERVRSRNLDSLPFREGLGVGSGSLPNEGAGDVDPVVVMGDFNANADNPAIMRLIAVDSPTPVDTYAAMHPADLKPYTYHEFTGGDVDGKIDYIFASPEWAVDSAEIVRANVDGRYPSDHFPVTATLSLHEPSSP